jgi:hypothetical protein
MKILGISFCLLLVSCSVEKVSVSPATTLLSEVSYDTFADAADGIETKIEFINYSSEINNAFQNSLISFSKKEVNEEVSALKFTISEYLYAVKEHNMVGKEKSFFNYEKSYKKLQKLKNKLNPEEQDTLNRFLVKIKTNISLIESLKDTP